MVLHQECAEILAEHGVAVSRYRTVGDALTDPQLMHRGALTEIDDSLGRFKTLNPPFHISNTDTTAGSHVLKLGEHTREILKEMG